MWSRRVGSLLLAFGGPALTGCGPGEPVLVRDHPGFHDEGALGSAVAALGDLDGDGIGEYAASAPNALLSGWEPARGQVVVYSGASGDVLERLELEDAEGFGQHLVAFELDSRTFLAAFDSALGPTRFAPRRVVCVPVGGAPGETLWEADFSNAAVHDLLCSVATNTLCVVGGAADGAFAELLSLDGGETRRRIWLPERGRTMTGRVALLEDRDGDHQPDLVIGVPERDEVRVMWSSGESVVIAGARGTRFGDRVCAMELPGSEPPYDLAVLSAHAQGVVVSLVSVAEARIVGDFVVPGILTSRMAGQDAVGMVHSTRGASPHGTLVLSDARAGDGGGVVLWIELPSGKVSAAVRGSSFDGVGSDLAVLDVDGDGLEETIVGEAGRSELWEFEGGVRVYSGR